LDCLKWIALPIQVSAGRAALCGTQADAAADEQLRALWISMEEMWTTLAAHKERLERLNVQGSV
jgi:hypothetical protein